MTSRPLAQLQNTAVLRAAWLVIALSVVVLLIVGTPLRYQMLQSDVYGYESGLQTLGLSLSFFAAYFVSWELMVAICSLGVATLITWKRGHDWYAMLVAITLSLIGLLPPLIDGISFAYPQWTVSIALLRLALLGGLMAMFCLFPNGRFAPNWMRWLLIAYLAFSLLVAVFQPDVLADTAVLPNMRTFADGLWLLIGGSWFTVAIVGQIIRYRRYSSHAERQQTKWVLLGFSAVILFSIISPLLLVIFPQLNNTPDGRTLFTLIVGPLFLISALALPTTFTLSILRYRLWDVDILFNRTLVYGGLTGLVTAVYILLVGGIGTLAANQSGQIVGLVLATAVVAAGIRPLRQRWQTAVNRYIPLPDPPSRPKTAVPPQLASEKTQPVKPLHGPKRWLMWFSLLLATILTSVLLGVTAVFTNLSLNQWVFFLITPAYVTVGTIIILRHPQNRIGRLCLLIGWLWLPLQIGFYQGAFITFLNQSTALIPPFIQLSQSGGQVVCLLIFVYLPLLFPDGQYQSVGWQRFGRGLALLITIPIMLTLIKSGPIFDWANGAGALAVQNPFGIHWPWLTNLPIEPLIYAWGIPTMLATFAAIISLGLRWRQSDRNTRQQIKWVVFFLSTLVALFMLIELMFWLFGPFLRKTAVFPLIEFIYNSLAVIVWVGFPLIIGLAVLKYRLYDIDIIVNRTLVYGGLSLGVVAVYALMVGGLSLLFQAQNNLLISLLATGLIAVLFQPVRQRLQQGVNRLMFGERDDPYAALSKLGTQLQTTATPAAMLQSVVKTIATTLKLPYVAIQLADEQGRLDGAATGKAVADIVELPLRYQNETVGYLVVSLRSPGESFTEREERLLADMAGQAGAMAYSVRLTAALQRSREKLVLTREEERRRIRRDLHDELGPTLASQTFVLDTALDLLETDPRAAAHLLQSLKAQNQQTVADVRRLVYELRPPALDELGVVAALQAHVMQLNGGKNLQIHIIATPDPLPPLSAAVEVAAYRIVLEAMTNVVRHAQAKRCDVCLKVVENGRSHLHIEVTDDGIGLPAELRPGVGLASMRERAEELGGQCEVVAGDNSRGTRITAVLPLATNIGAA